MIHPFLFAAFPVLFMFAHNIGELQLSVIIIPIAVVLTFTSLMLLSANLILRDNSKAAILVSFALVLFFSYGPFSNLMQGLQYSVGSFIIGPHKLFLMAGGLLFYLGAHFVIRTRENLKNFTKVLNVVALSLVLISTISIGADKFTRWRARIGSGEEVNTTINKNLFDEAARLPNIYYIVLDSYGRADILREVYGYDNREFINYLKQRGFYVADRSKSNYHATVLSLASSLNLSYLDPADGSQEEKFSNNRVFSYMKQRGYKTVFVSSLDSDLRMSKADFHFRIGGLNDFDHQLIKLTPVPELLNKLQLSLGSYNQHRERIHHVFDTITDIAGWNSPVFVYAHVLAPHPPFVFGPNGENVEPNREYSVQDAKIFLAEGGTRDEYIKGYRDQVQFVNKKVEKLIDYILSPKDSFSIIILQGDHGPRSMADQKDPDKTYLKEAYSILNAYCLPGEGQRGLYESITPVNTFRLVFNHYFGENYGLLEDRSYHYNATLSPPIVDVTARTDNGMDHRGTEVLREVGPSPHLR